MTGDIYFVDATEEPTGYNLAVLINKETVRTLTPSDCTCISHETKVKTKKSAMLSDKNR